MRLQRQPISMAARPITTASSSPIPPTTLVEIRQFRQPQSPALFRRSTSNPAGDAQPINSYLNSSLSSLTATYAAAMVARGKTAINYEGGPDWQVAVGAKTEGNHVITAADSAFLTAALDSTQWRDAQVGYFNRTSQVAGSALPSVSAPISAGLTVCQIALAALRRKDRACSTRGPCTSRLPVCHWHFGVVACEAT
jgi:hypothetical protein